MKVMDYHEAIFASELTSNARLTALAISKYYNWTKNQPCWPSNKTIALATGLSIRSIIRSKNELVSQGYLLSERRYDMTNTYIPCVPQSHGSCHTDALVVTDWQPNNEYNNEVNNEINNEKNITDSNESVVSINNLHQEDGETILDLNEKASFDDLFNMFEGNSLDTKKDNRRRPAGGGHRNNTKINQSSRSDDYSDAEKSRFTEELDFARNSEW